ncbi:MAG: hypothetical protein BAA02_00185 [Paenibacillaceae bacterium ZCTH02-B3]|nr:MAG: hypothetical protein BAA02_00185 [Paenibacillaceae bacterium ZCTH02-B3]
MINPYDKAHELARALKECAEAKDWLAAQKELAGDADGWRMLEDFRGRQEEIAKALSEGREVSEDEKKKVGRLYEVIVLHPGVRRVLEAEQRLVRLLADVQRIIGDAWNELTEQGYKGIKASAAASPDAAAKPDGEETPDADAKTG